MEQSAGLDVSLESTSVCLVEADGRVVREAKIASEPETLIAWFQAHGTPIARIGLEAGPLSPWLYAGLRAAGLAAELIEALDLTRFRGRVGGWRSSARLDAAVVVDGREIAEG